MNDEPQLALQVRDCTYAEAFATLKADLRYRIWRERIEADNARQLEQLRARQAESPAA